MNLLVTKYILTARVVTKTSHVILSDPKISIFKE